MSQNTKASHKPRRKCPSKSTLPKQTITFTYCTLLESQWTLKISEGLQNIIITSLVQLNKWLYFWKLREPPLLQATLPPLKNTFIVSSNNRYIFHNSEQVNIYRKEAENEDRKGKCDVNEGGKAARLRSFCRFSASLAHSLCWSDAARLTETPGPLGWRWSASWWSFPRPRDDSGLLGWEVGASGCVSGACWSGL